MTEQAETVNSRAKLQRMEEARKFLRMGIYTKGRVRELIKNLAPVRGEEAAEAMRVEMLHQWNTRAFWWGEGCPK